MSETAAPLAASVTTAEPAAPELLPVPEGWDRGTVEDFVYREARLADEHDYDGWEELWTPDALYWVPAGSPDIDPTRQVSVVYDNRNRISTRLKQLRTGKRYAQAPPSNLRRILGNVELLGGRPGPDGGVDLEVGANVIALESRARGTEIWGGRVTYRLRRRAEGIGMSYKKVVLVDLDRPIPTLGFLL